MKKYFRNLSPQMIKRTVPLDHIPVFGREGSLLPLGPAVQHTGELNPDLHLCDLWVFGDPQEGISLPGLKLSVANGKILNLPKDIRVKYWMAIIADCRENNNI